MRKHGVWMLIGCVVPLLLIFVLPLLGLRGELVIFFAVLLMFAFHLLMILGVRSMHEADREGGNRVHVGKKEERHESH